MSKSDLRARDALAQQGIRSPRDLAQWAKARGLLSVYIEFTPRALVPAHWQVVHPGHKTDPSGPAWQRGNKTWTCASVEERHARERFAAAWAGARYAVEEWVRIGGLGPALFPLPVAEELRRYAPDVPLYRKKQQVSPK